MKYDKITVEWICPHCDRSTEVTVYPIVPAVVSGPPERCYPQEGGEWEPDECSHCRRLIGEEVFDLAADEVQERAEEAAEHKLEALRDEH